MRRFLIANNDGGAKLSCETVPGSSSSGEILVVDVDDLTNCPDDDLLASAGREFSGRRTVPQQQWFASYPWLQISKSKKVVMCSWCREAIKNRVHGTSKSEYSFTEKGFNNWKDESSKIAEHSLSTAHRAAAQFMAQ